MEQEIGVAVVGYGLAGRVFHAPFVSAVPGLRLRAIVQRHGDEAATAYPEAETGVRVLRDAEQALAAPEIDLIVVGTPNQTHFQLAKAALQAGKHVVVDKPLTGTSAEARELIGLAAARQRVLAPFHNRRWDGDFKTVRSLLATERLGRLVSYQSRFDRFRPFPREGSWKEQASDAHGMLFDLGPHLIDQALALFGTPDRISASVRRERDGTAIEDAFDVTLQFGRLQALLGGSMVAAEPAPRFLLHGTRGSYRTYGVDPQEPALVGGARVPRLGSEAEWLREPESSFGELAIADDPKGAPGQIRREVLRTEPGDYREFYANVRDAILGRAKLAVTGEDAWRVLRLLELARESSERGCSLPAAL